ncbi:Pre-mRNA splicing factor ATP-dependent RNA helicase PRP43 [Trichoderma simmonsii]|uniref:Pre-mRNA splicing factor ATP-dependent RNA helicase PRP43 n=1 Tax=Trichoderma simmonsii TaxID=1491479 RepID=A0A8G0PNW8_9HYPO|nr:Pre-mRNA splicing factor ATP-dependent RNA helicase PRP43 [Trichoderma simmonsii]
MILSSETGSGKSTQVGSGIQIACTQPCRLAATELASRVADEMGVVLGEEVGYQIGGVSMVNKNKQKKTRLAYMTEGVLLRKLSMDRQSDLHPYEARKRRRIKSLYMTAGGRPDYTSLAYLTLFSSSHVRLRLPFRKCIPRQFDTTGVARYFISAAGQRQPNRQGSHRYA